MRYHPAQRNIVWTVLFSIFAALALNACGDSNNVSGPPTPVEPGALAIATSTLPSGSRDIFYDVTLAPSGGAPPYSWRLSSGSLPNGLTLASSGRISGKPTTVQTTTPTFRLQDSAVPNAAVVTKLLPMSITAVPQPTITTPSPLPNGILNQQYQSTTLTVVGGTPSYTFSATVTPALPSGLTFNAATATISGIPTATETNITHTFSVTDSFFPTPQTVSKGLALTVSRAPLPLTITTNSPLPGGTVTQQYPTPQNPNIQLAAIGGTPPLTWDLAPGSPALPNGLQLSSGGVLSGTPSTAVNVTPVFRVRDAATSPQQTATKPLAIAISLPAALNITTGSLPNGVLNQAYDQTVAANGGSGTRSWSFQGGTIPNLTINSSTGRITGNPTPTGPFTFTVQVTDALFTDSQSYTITITAPLAPSITTSSLPIGTVNTAYSAQLQAINGAPPLNFQPMGLPFGLTFNATPNSSTATITGTPTSSGSQNVTFTVNDSTVPFNQTGTRTLRLAVNAALTIDTTSPLPSGCTHTSYGPVILMVSGGTPPYTWTTTASPALPAGLSITPSPSATATISGTPTAPDNQSHTFTVRDSSANPPATKGLSLTINGTLTITTLSPLPAGKVGDSYGPITLTACGGTPPYTWSQTVTPPLPTGLSIDAAGTISGIPTVDEANISHTFTVTDSANTSANATLSLTIAP